MNKFTCLLFGMETEVFNALKPSTRARYHSVLLSLFISVFVSAFVAIDVYYNLNDGRLDCKVIPIVIIWMIIVGAVDVSLIRNIHSTHYFRLLFTVGVVVISLICALNLVLHKDVEESFLTENETNKDSLYEDYMKKNKSRYAASEKKIEDIEEEKQSYNKNVLIPESHIGYADKKYNKKKIHYDQLSQRIKEVDSLFNVKEKIYSDKYDAKVERLQNFAMADVGFFKSMKRTLTMILQDAFYLLIAIAIMCVLLGLETVVFSITMKFDHSKYMEEERKWFRNIKSQEAIRQYELNKQATAHQLFKELYLITKHINMLDRIKDLNKDNNNNPVLNSLISEKQDNIIEIFNLKYNHSIDESIHNNKM